MNAKKAKAIRREIKRLEAIKGKLPDQLIGNSTKINPKNNFYRRFKKITQAANVSLDKIKGALTKNVQPSR